MAKNVGPWSNVGPLAGPTVKPGTKEVRYRNSAEGAYDNPVGTGPGKNVKAYTSADIPASSPGQTPMPLNAAQLKKAAARKFKTKTVAPRKTMKLGVNAVQEGRAKTALRKRSAVAQSMASPASKAALSRRLAYK